MFSVHAELDPTKVESVYAYKEANRNLWFVFIQENHSRISLYKIFTDSKEGALHCKMKFPNAKFFIEKVLPANAIYRNGHFMRKDSDDDWEYI